MKSIRRTLWNAFNGLWRSDNNRNQDTLTNYQRSILQEFWYVLEDFDPNKEGATDDRETDFSVVQEKAKIYYDMVLNDKADQNSEPFADLITPAHVDLGGATWSQVERVFVDQILDSWPQHRDQLVLHNGEWHPFHDWFANVDRTNIWVDFVLNAFDEECEGAGMRLSTGQTVLIRKAE